MRIRKGVAGIIFKPDGPLFLVLKRAINWEGWEFVKGSIGNNEIKETAVRREILEETGLEEIELIYKFPGRMEYEHKESSRNLAGFSGSSHTVFLVKYIDGEVVLSHEHSDFKWLPYEEARETLTFENQRMFLDSAMEFLRHKYH